MGERGTCDIRLLDLRWAENGEAGDAELELSGPKGGENAELELSGPEGGMRSSFPLSQFD